MKKISSIFLLLVLAACMLTSCEKEHLDKTMYWENSKYCLELTTDGQATIYKISSEKYSAFYSGTYRLYGKDESASVSNGDGTFTYFDFGISPACEIPFYFNGLYSGRIVDGRFDNNKSVVYLEVYSLEKLGAREEIKLNRTSLISK